MRGATGSLVVVIELTAGYTSCCDACLVSLTLSGHYKGGSLKSCGVFAIQQGPVLVTLTDFSILGTGSVSCSWVN